MVVEIEMTILGSQTQINGVEEEDEGEEEVEAAEVDSTAEINNGVKTTLAEEIINGKAIVSELPENQGLGHNKLI